MKVDFTQSGGFLGGCRGCELDTAKLPADTGEKLVDLAKASGISASGTFFSASGRDLQQYDITIHDGYSEISVTFDDETLPPAVQPLIDYLQKHARPKTLKD